MGPETSRSSSQAIFGSAPSYEEVERAASELQSFAGEIAGSGTGKCRAKHLLDVTLGELRTLLTDGYKMVTDAFQLLQTEPSIKKLIVSLASDKAIWDAVMNNEMVKKIRESTILGQSITYGGGNEGFNIQSRFLEWIAMIVKAIAGQLITRFQELLDEVLQTLTRRHYSYRRESSIAGNKAAVERVRSSFLLCILVMVIVVLERAGSI